MPAGLMQQPMTGQCRYQVRELQVRQLRVRHVRTAGSATRTAVAGATAAQGGASRTRPVAGRSGQSAEQLRAIRLTRRGRVVVAALAIMAVLTVVALLWLSVAGGAQASDRGVSPGSAYRGMTQVVVRPGQTLWSIASAAEPAADPRIVIQQIIDTNALSGATISAGQLLWVPKR